MISLIVTLVVVGVLLYLVEAFIPMDPKIKHLIQIVVVIAAVLYVLQALGVWNGLHLRG